MLRLVLVLAALTVAKTAAATETPIPPAPTHWATDTAGMMSEPARFALDQRLAAFERASGHQLIVWIGQTSGGVPIEDWSSRAFQSWRIGRRSLDDGVAIIVFAQDRRLRIEVGYGLESTLTDARSSQIIQEIAIPKLRANDPDGAISQSAEAVMQALGGGGSLGPAHVTSPSHAPLHGSDILRLVFFGILILGFLVLLVTHPTLAMFLLANILSGGRRGGGGTGGGDGGGFSGGGGRSGGGGASGSW